MTALKIVKPHPADLERERISLLDCIKEINSNSSVYFYEDQELYTPLIISEDQYEGSTTYFD